MGKRELAGLDRDLDLPTGRRGGTARQVNQMLPPPPPPRVQSDQEIQQHNLKIFIKSLGYMDADTKKQKIACWIVNYDAKKNNNDEAGDAGKKEDKEEQQEAQSKDTNKKDDENQQPDVELKDTGKNDQDDEEETAAKDGEAKEKEPNNKEEPKEDTSGKENKEVHADTVKEEEEASSSSYKRQKDEEYMLEAEDSDSDGHDSGYSVSSSGTLYQLQKPRQKERFNAAVFKEKQAEECWSSMQPKTQH